MSDLARTMLGAALLAVAACTPASTPTTNDGAAPSAAVAIPTAVACASGVPVETPSDAAAPFRCFSWAHERDFSTDCYRTQLQCMTELQHMKDGARLPTECVPTAHASCTTLQGGDERCFGDAPSCGRYRAFVGRNHLETTACVPR